MTSGRRIGRPACRIIRDEEFYSSINRTTLQPRVIMQKALRDNAGR